MVGPQDTMTLPDESLTPMPLQAGFSTGIDFFDICAHVSPDKRRKNSSLAARSMAMGLDVHDRSYCCKKDNINARATLSSRVPKTLFYDIRHVYVVCPEIFSQDTIETYKLTLSDEDLPVLEKIQMSENQQYRKEDGSVVPYEFFGSIDPKNIRVGLDSVIEAHCPKESHNEPPTAIVFTRAIANDSVIRILNRRNFIQAIYHYSAEGSASASLIADWIDHLVFSVQLEGAAAAVTQAQYAGSLSGIPKQFYMDLAGTYIFTALPGTEETLALYPGLRDDLARLGIDPKSRWSVDKHGGTECIGRRYEEHEVDFRKLPGAKLCNGQFFLGANKAIAFAVEARMKHLWSSRNVRLVGADGTEYAYSELYIMTEEDRMNVQSQVDPVISRITSEKIKLSRDKELEIEMGFKEKTYEFREGCIEDKYQLEREYSSKLNALEREHNSKLNALALENATLKAQLQTQTQARERDIALVMSSLSPKNRDRFACLLA